MCANILTLCEDRLVPDLFKTKSLKKKVSQEMSFIGMDPKEFKLQNAEETIKESLISERNSGRPSQKRNVFSQNQTRKVIYLCSKFKITGYTAKLCTVIIN